MHVFSSQPTFIWSVKTEVNLFSKCLNIKRYQRQKADSEKYGSKTPTRQFSVIFFALLFTRRHDVDDACLSLKSRMVKAALHDVSGPFEDCVA